MIHNELRKYTRLLQAIQAALGSSDGSIRIERVGETLTPIIDLWSRPEWGGLFGEALWWDFSTSPAVALQNSWYGVVNPAGSNCIVTLLGFKTDAGTAGSMPQATLTGGALTNADARDRRYGSSQSLPFPRISTGSEVGSTVTSSFLPTANVAAEFPVVISPGNNFAIQHPTVNTALNVSSWGIVRRAFAAELQNRTL